MSSVLVREVSYTIKGKGSHIVLKSVTFLIYHEILVKIGKGTEEEGE
jgi:hypothetical protein